MDINKGMRFEYDEKTHHYIRFKNDFQEYKIDIYNFKRSDLSKCTLELKRNLSF